LVRVDRAPALVSLAKDSNSELAQLGIMLQLPLDDNKNANCRVDKIIAELETEIKKISPMGEQISQSQLSQAVSLLNGKIRNRGLTAAEIQFSRDSQDQKNLQLDDDLLTRQQTEKKLANHESSARSKAPKGKIHSPPEVLKGDIVYIKHHGSKQCQGTPPCHVKQ
jgi:multidrug efflux pump subunit AcrB